MTTTLLVAALGGLAALLLLRWLARTLALALRLGLLLALVAAAAFHLSRGGHPGPSVPGAPPPSPPLIPR